MDYTTIIPWQRETIWEEVQLHFQLVGKVQHQSLSTVKTLAHEILSKINKVDKALSKLSRSTCGCCPDVCCNRATVWYDFRDLLFHHLEFGKIPQAQISRSNNGVCCYLGQRGCLLTRPHRPFICTWYLCPSQKESNIEWEEINNSERIGYQLEKIQEDRRMLEHQYIAAACQ